MLNTCSLPPVTIVLPLRAHQQFDYIEPDEFVADGKACTGDQQFDYLRRCPWKWDCQMGFGIKPDSDVEVGGGDWKLLGIGRGSI